MATETNTGSTTSVVLLSSGLDSTVNFFEAVKKSEVKLALTFDYGQRAAPRETQRAAMLAESLGVPHKVVELPFFKDFTHTSLINREAEIPTDSEVSIDDMEASTRTAKAVWVPNRNGIMLNIGAAFAEGIGAKWIIPGFNIEEAATFPDNTEEFLQAATGAFHYSTSNQVAAVCFTTQMNKTEIVKRGKELGVPFELVWPCYFDGTESNGLPCGECESCKRFKRACEAAGGV